MGLFPRLWELTQHCRNIVAEVEIRMAIGGRLFGLGEFEVSN